MCFCCIFRCDMTNRVRGSSTIYKWRNHTSRKCFCFSVLLTCCCCFVKYFMITVISALAINTACSNTCEIKIGVCLTQQWRQWSTTYLPYIILLFYILASYVGHRRGHPLSRNHGSGSPQTGGTDGPQTGGHRQELSMPDLRWKHDRMPWAFRTHRLIQTSFPCWFRNKDD